MKYSFVSVLLGVLAIQFVVSDASHWCSVHGYDQDFDCNLELWENNTASIAKSPTELLHSDNVYPSLTAALKECPFDPVEIRIYGTVVVHGEALAYSGDANVLLKGSIIVKDDKLIMPRLLWFSGILLGDNRVDVEFDGLNVRSCGAFSHTY